MRAGFVGFLTVTIAGLCSCDAAIESEPAQGKYSRIVALAPHLAELVYAAGAGDSLVGVSAYSDYPPEVTKLPLVGDAFVVDQERLVLLRPDLLLVWKSGTPAHVVDELRRSGYKVEAIRTRGLDDIAAALIRIGELTGHVEHAQRASMNFRNGMNALRERYHGNTAIRVFYQISTRPLFTVNGEHYISELIDVCGGRNVFVELNELAPAVAVEAVLGRDPEVLMAGSDAGDDALDVWDRWPRIAANRYGNHFRMPSAEIGRATPRLLDAGKALCAALQTARERRATTEQHDASG